jgi:hypothetical protein
MYSDSVALLTVLNNEGGVAMVEFVRDNPELREPQVTLPALLLLKQMLDSMIDHYSIDITIESLLQAAGKTAALIGDDDEEAAV